MSTALLALYPYLYLTFHSVRAIINTWERGSEWRRLLPLPEIEGDGKMAKKIVPTVKFPEVGSFKTKKELQKHYKGLTDGELCEWIEIEGLEFKPSEHEAINRMRMCMAVLYKHFPAEAPKPKEKSKYAGYTDEQLIEMAVAGDVPVMVTEDARIMRMRVIMALKAHGKLA